MAQSAFAPPSTPTSTEHRKTLNVMAPAASCTSNLPVFMYFQGGAFNANTRPQFNSSSLIKAADDDMVVNFNYRVGL